jgi:hypothetical protein
MGNMTEAAKQAAADARQEIALEAYRLLTASYFSLADQTFHEKIELLRPFVRAHSTLDPISFYAMDARMEDVGVDDGLSLDSLMTIYQTLQSP